jgi:hypothetical protein
MHSDWDMEIDVGIVGAGGCVLTAALAVMKKALRSLSLKNSIKSVKTPASVPDLYRGPEQSTSARPG